MTSMMDGTLSRTDFLKTSGAAALFLTFGAAGAATDARGAVAGPWPDVDPRRLDSWIAVHPDNTVTFFTGKNDLGQGLETTFRQIVAEEMDLTVKQVNDVASDTARAVHQGGASGSSGVERGGVAVRNMAAEARRVLVERASQRLGVPVAQLSVREGVVSGGGKSITYGELLGGRLFDTTVKSNMRFGNGLTAEGKAQPKNPADYHIVGSPVPRIDIPDKVFGRYNFNVDARLPGMVHARIVRPPDAGAKIVRIGGFKQKMPGLVKVLPIGRDYVAVVAEREEQAIAASRTLQVTWSKPSTPPFPSSGNFFKYLRETPPRWSSVAEQAGNVDKALAGAAKVVQAEYLWPIQAHAGMGPSSALASYDSKTDTITVWSGTQKAHQIQRGIAELLGMPRDRVRVIWMMGPGSYGRGDADDGALEAAWISRQVGRPVRLQWMRYEGHGWDPKAPGAIMDVRGGLDANGRIVGLDWTWKGVSGQEVGTSGQGAGDTLVGMALGFERPERNRAGSPEDNYAIPNKKYLEQTVEHFMPMSNPLRTSHLRDPQGPQATFGSEQFIDELAHAAGADPIEFRLRHLDPDSSDAAVLRAAARTFGWKSRPAASKVDRSASVLKGRGIAYSTRGSYIGAVITELSVTPKTGKIRLERAVVASDLGLVINPDGFRNVVEGNYVFTASRALKEEVRYSRRNVTSVDWVTYPILNAMEVPQRIESVTVNDEPGRKPGPAGEGPSRPVPASIANAFFDATGVRIRRAPMTPAHVRAALREAGF